VGGGRKIRRDKGEKGSERARDREREKEIGRDGEGDREGDAEGEDGGEVKWSNKGHIRVKWSQIRVR
jgi:hypothetical protein